MNTPRAIYRIDADQWTATNFCKLRISGNVGEGAALPDLVTDSILSEKVNHIRAIEGIPLWVRTLIAGCGTPRTDPR